MKHHNSMTGKVSSFAPMASREGRGNDWKGICTRLKKQRCLSTNRFITEQSQGDLGLGLGGVRLVSNRDREGGDRVD